MGFKMTHYSESENSVRVDFFKESGKWYTTEAVKWDNDIYKGLINECFKTALIRHLKSESGFRLSGMIAVCLDPYHEHSFPLMCRVAELEK